MKKLLSTAMALVLIIGLLTGCSVESQGEKTESVSNQYYLYYLNKNESNKDKILSGAGKCRIYAPGFNGNPEWTGEQRREPAFASSRSSAGDLPLK